MNISSIFDLRFWDCDINVKDFEELLVPSIKVIHMFDLRTFPNIDLALLVMKKLPALTHVLMDWQFEISSIDSLIAVERPRTLMVFTFMYLPENFPFIDVEKVKRFNEKNMISEFYTICFKTKSKVLYPFSANL